MKKSKFLFLTIFVIFILIVIFFIIFINTREDANIKQEEYEYGQIKEEWQNNEDYGELVIEENSTEETIPDIIETDAGLTYERLYIPMLNGSLYIPKDWTLTFKDSFVYLQNKTDPKFYGIEIAITSGYLPNMTPSLLRDKFTASRYEWLEYHATKTYTVSTMTSGSAYQILKDPNVIVYVDVDKEALGEYVEYPSARPGFNTREDYKFIGIYEHPEQIVLTTGNSSNFISPYGVFYYSYIDNTALFVSTLGAEDKMIEIEDIAKTVSNSLVKDEKPQVNMKSLDSQISVYNLTLPVSSEFSISGDLEKYIDFSNTIFDLEYDLQMHMKSFVTDSNNVNMNSEYVQGCILSFVLSHTDPRDYADAKPRIGIFNEEESLMGGFRVVKTEYSLDFNVNQNAKLFRSVKFTTPILGTSYIIYRNDNESYIVNFTYSEGSKFVAEPYMERIIGKFEMS